MDIDDMDMENVEGGEDNQEAVRNQQVLLVIGWHWRYWPIECKLRWKCVCSKQVYCEKWSWR